MLCVTTMVVRLFVVAMRAVASLQPLPLVGLHPRLAAGADVLADGRAMSLHVQAPLKSSKSVPSPWLKTIRSPTARPW